MDDGRHTALKKVKVDRKKLIEKLKENLKKHKQEHKEAMAGFRIEQKKLMKVLHAATEACNENPSNETRDAVVSAFREWSGLDVPANHARSYKKAITVMEWREEAKVKLSMNDFQCYVEDDWNWKRGFRHSFATYANNG